MNELQASIISLLAIDVKIPDVGFALEKELADPALLSRGTYARLVVLLFDNDTRKLFGLDPIMVNKDQRKEIQQIMRNSNYFYVAGVGVMPRREPAPAKKKPPVGKFHAGTPKKEAAKPQAKKKEKEKPKMAVTDATATAIIGKLPTEGMSADHLRSRDHGVRYPDYMNKRTYKQLNELEKALSADKNTNHDMQTAMVASGIKLVLTASPWKLDDEGKVVSKIPAAPVAQPETAQ